MRCLTINLDGLFQSYSQMQGFGRKETEKIPTKSAVVGLAVAALGLDRDDPFIDKIANETEMFLKSKKYKNVSQKIYTDYQTATPWDGEYWMSANGQKADLQGPIERNKDYLIGAKYTVYITGNEKMLDTLAEAFIFPKRFLYLGRSNCFPQSPVFESYHSVDEEEINKCTELL